MSGRRFTEAEASGAAAPVVILSEQAAATLWPGQNAVGRLVRLAPDSRVPDAYKPPFPVVEVIGVARTVLTSWDEAMRATIYAPMSITGSNLNILVRTRGGNVSATMRQIDADLSAAAPGVAQQIIAAQDLVEARVYPFQAMSWAAGVIGGLALVLTISGIYSVLAYAVARRTKEIGIRMALGAGAAGLVGLILKQSMRLCAIGLVLADGKLIILDQDGVLALATVDRQGIKVLSKVELLQRVAWTPPTLVGTRLYVRDRNTIMALDLGA